MQDNVSLVNCPQEKDEVGSLGGLFGGGVGDLECHSCDAGNCEEEEEVELHGEVDVIPKKCTNAIRCYTAHVRDADGVEHKSKGENTALYVSL